MVERLGEVVTIFAIRIVHTVGAQKKEAKAARRKELPFLSYNLSFFTQG
jgi:hypothetical protein